jgi:hypothetical protein
MYNTSFINFKNRFYQLLPLEQLFATSIVTVPVLGLGEPLGPKYDLMDPLTHNAWHSDDYINICPTRFNFAK